MALFCVVREGVESPLDLTRETTLTRLVDSLCCSGKLSLKGLVSRISSWRGSVRDLIVGVRIWMLLIVNTYRTER